MNEERLKAVLRFKMSLLGKMVDSLPDDVRKMAEEREAKIIQVIYELSKEYMENPPAPTGGQSADLKIIKVQ